MRLVTLLLSAALLFAADSFLFTFFPSSGETGCLAL
jgi:hypothetical protein